MSELDRALELHRAGRLDEAAERYRAVLAARPDHGDALHLLGVVAHQQGRHEEAVTTLRRAVAADGHAPAYQNSLGEALRASGRLDEAVDAYRRVLALAPDYADALSNLGLALAARGDPAAAVDAFESALAKGDDRDTRFHLGNALRGLGRLDDAVAAYRRALELDPDFAEAAANLGAALRQQGKAAQAIASYRRAVAISPHLAEVHYNLGIALEDDGLRDEAIAAYRRALTLAPDFVEARNNLGQALRAEGLLGEAIEHYQHALGVALDADTLNNLGNALLDQMRFAEAFEAFDRSLELDPGSASGHSNRLFAMHYLPDVGARELLAAHRDWAERHAARFASGAVLERHATDPTRRLRIGYVSADLRTHSVAYFIEPILECHDRAGFEIHCYADVRHADAATRRLQGLADRWCDIVRMDDDEVCARVREDEIDILVDLAGHTANNRLLVFARRAAPVQVTYLGYPDTTGLATMDYRLTDALADPPGESDGLLSETLIRLPGFLCYRPPPDAPPVGTLPAAACGHVTFASFNNSAKLNDAVVESWAQILRELPEARLLLKARSLADADTRERLRRRFAGHGIEAERVELLPPATAAAAHLAVYQRADIALDTFPYNGATTTCEALWMGVPVITFTGGSHAGRVGRSLLTRAGLAELVAADVREYADRAVALARDEGRLRALRSSLRDRLLASPLMNSRRFTAELEDAYRAMIRRRR